MSFPFPRKSYFALSFFYFFDFASLGFFLPYFPLYLKNLQMSEWEIGFLLSVLMIARVGIPIFWGRLSDLSGRGYEIFLMNTLLSSVILAALFFTKSFWGIFFVLAASMFFRTSLIPLAEAMSLKFMSHTKTSYGFIRVWGSLGFLSASILGGFLINFLGIKIVPAFLVITFCASTLAISFLDPEEPRHTAPDISAWKHLLHRNFVVMLVAGMLMQASHAAYYEYFSIYLMQQGAEPWLIGLLWSVAILSEIFMMLSWRKLNYMGSTYVVLSSSFIFAALRWWGLSAFHSFNLIAILQTLHAFSFAAFHLANIYWLKKNISFHDQSTAQALYSSIVFGLGGAIGFLGAGALTQSITLSTLYFWSGAVALLGFFVFVMGFKTQRSSSFI